MNPSHNQWLSIRASAGSGKTFALSLRYIYLLFLGARPNEILCITFTTKAQHEMQERISKTLLEIYESKDTPYIKELLNLGLSREDIHEHIKHVYSDFLSTHNHIMTFDAFFNMILKKFSFYAGLLNNYQLNSDFGLAEEIFERTLNLISKKDFDDLKNFCTDNQLASKHIKEILKNIDENDIISQYTKRNENVFDFEEFCAEVIDLYHELREYMLRFTQFELDSNKSAFGLTNEGKRFVKILEDGANIKELLGVFEKIHLTDNMLEKLEKKQCDMDFVNARICAIEACFKEYFDSVEQQIFSLIARIYHAFLRARREVLSSENKLTFSDVSAFCHELLNKHFDKDFFYFRLDSRVNHILVDEFQDTNMRQYFILKPLIDEIRSGVGRMEARSLFFVGDEKQAIYGFRGSNSRLFAAISNELKMNDSFLETNYRSAKCIIEFVNNTFGDIFENYCPQNAASDVEGYVCARAVPKDEILHSIKERVETLLAHNRRDIAILTRTTKSAQETFEYLQAEIPHIKIAVKNNAIDTSFLIIKNAIYYIQTRNELYLKNCLKLSGKSFFESIELSVNENLAPINIVYKIMQVFCVYDKAALLLLQESAKYENLKEFSEALEFYSDDFVDDAKECDVKITTIHSSKGLEFSDVIVSEFSGERHTDDTFYYDYEKLTLSNVFYLKNAKARALADSDFKESYERYKVQKRMEALNLLYVAFTRAKESLYVIKPAASTTSKGTETKTSTIFDNLALDDCTFGKDVLGNSAESTSKPAKNAPMLIEQESFGAQDDFIQKETIQSSIHTQMRGNALHLALEHALKYKENTMLEHILKNRFGLLLDDETLRDVLESMNNILNNAVIKEYLRDCIDIQCEAIFINKANKLRRIDCILHLPARVVILDYKSSDFNIQSKENQIREYLAFVREQIPQKDVEAYLCFADGNIHKVE